MTDTFQPIGAVAARVVEKARAQTQVQRIPIADHAAWLAMRKHDVTASVVAALLGQGVHDYMTAYELYDLKTGGASDDPEETGPMRRGRLLEPVAVQLLREQQPTWKITHNSGAGAVYLRDPSIRLGATVDVFVEDPARGPGIVQIKSVEGSVYNRKWRDPDTNELRPPLWIAVQSITEAHLAGAQWAAVAPIVVGFGIDLPVIEVPVHEGLIKRIRSSVVQFWEMVAAGKAPPPDFAKDGALIARMYDQDNGETVNLGGNRIVEVVARRDQLKEIESAGTAASKERKDLDVEILHALGEATTGILPDGTVISAKTVRRGAYTVQPTSYRPIKIKPARPPIAAE
ncbi:YqaJ viral recombinase family protein [Ancylobacter sp. VNQ12]|uniref:YqaJ viral recombinase family nuclease n=1 Tax=Ancylobacter sp. VNQ12 TaxID=3400920 RepID=UPI003C0E2779